MYYVHHVGVRACRELRTKDLERIQNIIDDLNSKVKRGLTKEQKEDLATAEKVKEWLDSGKDVRYKLPSSSSLLSPTSCGVHVFKQGVSVVSESRTMYVRRGTLTGSALPSTEILSRSFGF